MTEQSTLELRTVCLFFFLSCNLNCGLISEGDSNFGAEERIFARKMLGKTTIGINVVSLSKISFAGCNVILQMLITSFFFF